ncbi:MAG: SMC-Scp complex subunit ScpB, partial [Candidatus Acidiferrales bacterium]
EKRLITTAGRKPVIGRPILYRTSKDFLMRFGLSDLEELPSLKEFEQLAQAALGTDDGIAPIEPEERGVEPQANVAGEAATGEIADAPKAAVVAAGATSSSSTASTPARTDTANSPTTDVAAPESSSPEEIISGADGD